MVVRSSIKLPKANFRPVRVVTEPLDDVPSVAAVVPENEFSAATYFKQFYDPNVTASKLLDQITLNQRNQISKFNDDVAAVMNSEGPTVNLYRGTYAYSQERKEVHKEIIRKILTKDVLERATPAAGEQPKFVTFGGRGGSGKSFFTKEGSAVIDKDRFLILDNDEIKKLLPEYKGWNAATIHEETSHLFELITRYARRKGLNIVHDSTLKSTASAIRRMDGFAQRGYVMEGYYMFLPRQEAAVRAIHRALGPTKRYVPVEIILGNTTNEATFDAIKSRFIRWKFFDNQVPRGQPPKLIAGSAT